MVYSLGSYCRQQPPLSLEVALNILILKEFSSKVSWFFGLVDEQMREGKKSIYWGYSGLVNKQTLSDSSCVRGTAKSSKTQCQSPDLKRRLKCDLSLASFCSLLLGHWQHQVVMSLTSPCCFILFSFYIGSLLCLEQLFPFPSSLEITSYPIKWRQYFFSFLLRLDWFGTLIHSISPLTTLRCNCLFVFCPSLSYCELLEDRDLSLAFFFFSAVFTFVSLQPGTVI